MVQRSPVLFLENELRLKEDLMFLGALASECMGGIPTGGLVNIRSLRPFLMGRMPALSFTDFDVPNETRDENAWLRRKLQSLHAWCHASRKVYGVTEELKDLLLGMSFGELEWTDLLFPYESFVLALESPITVPYEDDPISGTSILVSRVRESEGAEPVLMVRFVTNEIHAYQPLSSYDKSRLRQKRRLSMILSAIDLLKSRVVGIRDLNLTISESHFADLKIADTNARFTTMMEGDDDYSSIYRLIAGFCFYLQTLPSGSSHQSAWTRVRNPGKPDPNAITNGAEICTVASSVKLTPRERQEFSGERNQTEREHSAHFRRGFFRRAPGTGHDPTAPKVVLVRPTLVRGDRLQPGELVGGTQVKVELP